MFILFKSIAFFYCLTLRRKNGGNQNGKRNYAYLFSFEIITYPQGKYGLDDNPVEITPAETVKYEDAILAAIAKENLLFESDRELVEYIHDETLNKKVYTRSWLGHGGVASYMVRNMESGN